MVGIHIPLKNAKITTIPVLKRYKCCTFLLDFANLSKYVGKKQKLSYISMDNVYHLHSSGLSLDINSSPAIIDPANINMSLLYLMKFRKHADYAFYWRYEPSSKKLFLLWLWRVFLVKEQPHSIEVLSSACLLWRCSLTKKAFIGLPF